MIGYAALGFTANMRGSSGEPQTATVHLPQDVYWRWSHSPMRLSPQRMSGAVFSDERGCFFRRAGPVPAGRPVERPCDRGEGPRHAAGPAVPRLLQLAAGRPGATRRQAEVSPSPGTR